MSSVGVPVAIGGRPSLTFLVGGVWEIVAFKGSVSVADVAKLEAYAKAKYAL